MRLDEFQGVNAGYVLELYERYRQNPDSVDPATRKAFESWTPGPADAVSTAGRLGRHAASRRSSAPPTWPNASAATDIWRRSLDPLGSAPVGDPSLAPAAHGITDDDLRRLPASLVGGPVAESSANAFEAIEKLRRIYCSTTGFDYAHVFVPEEREWLRHAAESGRFLPPMDAHSAEALLDRTDAGRGVRALSAPDVPRQDALLDRRARHARADARRDHLRRRRPGRASRRCSAWRIAAA